MEETLHEMQPDGWYIAKDFEEYMPAKKATCNCSAR